MGQYSWLRPLEPAVGPLPDDGRRDPRERTLWRSREPGGDVDARQGRRRGGDPARSPGAGTLWGNAVHRVDHASLDPARAAHSGRKLVAASRRIPAFGAGRDRKGLVEGKRELVRVDLGGSRICKKQKRNNTSKGSYNA